MNGAFAERITVIDVWSSGSNLYRLVNRGAGPLQLQKYESDGTVEEWIPESTQYVHGVLCHRIAMLSGNRGDGMKNDTGGDGRPTVSEKMPERERFNAWRGPRPVIGFTQDHIAWDYETEKLWECWQAARLSSGSVVVDGVTVEQTRSLLSDLLAKRDLDIDETTYRITELLMDLTSTEESPNA